MSIDDLQIDIAQKIDGISENTMSQFFTDLGMMIAQ